MSKTRRPNSCLRSDDIRHALVEEIKILEAEGKSQNEIGRILGVSSTSIYRVFKELGLRQQKPESVSIACKSCGKMIRQRKFTTRPNRGKFCSKVCYTTWQKSSANKGENNPRWKGGHNGEFWDHLKRSESWVLWRTSVYIRDSYTCFLCRSHGGRLEAHHIIKKTVRPDLMFLVENGITLCKECHRNNGVHRKSGGPLVDKQKELMILKEYIPQSPEQKRWIEECKKQSAIGKTKREKAKLKAQTQKTSVCLELWNKIKPLLDTTTLSEDVIAKQFNATRGRIKYWKKKLGYNRPGRLPKTKLLDKECPVCRRVFRPYYISMQYCSRECYLNTYRGI